MFDYRIVCQWCGNIHAGICSKVKAIEYFEDGTVKRVEFFEDDRVDWSNDLKQKEMWRDLS